MNCALNDACTIVQKGSDCTQDKHKISQDAAASNAAIPSVSLSH
jgi:hypothetical protein